MYTKILVPLDGSKRAEKIFPHVEALAQKFGSQLILLQVVEPIPSTFIAGDMAPYYNEEMTTQWLEAAKAYLLDTQTQLQAKGIAVKTHIENGSIVQSILNVAGEEDVDLIAIASHGRTGLARVFFGSVAAGILNQADRALLLIRAQD